MTNARKTAGRLIGRAIGGTFCMRCGAAFVGGCIPRKIEAKVIRKREARSAVDFDCIYETSDVFYLCDECYAEFLRFMKSRNFEKYQEKDQKTFDEICEYMKSDRKKGLYLLDLFDEFHKDVSLSARMYTTLLLIKNFNPRILDWIVWFLRQPYRQQLLILTQLSDMLDTSPPPFRSGAGETKPSPHDAPRSSRSSAPDTCQEG